MKKNRVDLMHIFHKVIESTLHLAEHGDYIIPTFELEKEVQDIHRLINSEGNDEFLALYNLLDAFAESYGHNLDSQEDEKRLLRKSVVLLKSVNAINDQDIMKYKNFRRGGILSQFISRFLPRTKKVIRRRPLNCYHLNTKIQYPFPDSLLTVLSQDKMMLWSTSYGDVTDSNLLKMVAYSIFDNDCSMLIIPAPNDKELNNFDQCKFLKFNGKSFLMCNHENSTTEIFRNYFHIIESSVNHEKILFFHLNQQLYLRELFKKIGFSMEIADESYFFELMKIALKFIYIDFDGFLLVGQDQDFGNWVDIINHHTKL